jgi:hypothetical protein
MFISKSYVNYGRFTEISPSVTGIPRLIRVINVLRVELLSLFPHYFYNMMTI